MGGTQAIHQRLGFTRGQGRRRKNDVLQGLGQDPAEPDNHAGPELGVPHEAGDQLTRPRYLLGHQQSHRPVFGPRLGEQDFGGGFHPGSVGQPHLHQPALGLVGDAIAAEFQHHRKTQAFGCKRRLSRCFDSPFTRERNIKIGEQILRGGFGEGRGELSCHGRAA